MGNDRRAMMGYELKARRQLKNESPFLLINSDLPMNV